MALHLLILSACANVTLKDSTWDGSLGIDGAAEFHVMTEETARLNYQQWQARWNDLTHPMVATDIDTMLDWKADIEKLCSFENHCTYEQQQSHARVMGFLRWLEDLKTEAAIRIQQQNLN